MKAAVRRLLAATIVALLAGCGGGQREQTHAALAPVATPPGVLLVPVPPTPATAPPDTRDLSSVPEGEPEEEEAIVLRLATGTGEVLYRRIEGAPCPAECAAAFAPFRAQAVQSEELVDWTLTPLPDGGHQWVYRGAPLFVRTNEDGKVDEAAWTVALYEPQATLTLPPGMRLRESRVLGWILTDHRDSTLYRAISDLDTLAKRCDARCMREWLPVEAPALANPVGEFAPIERADGARQWAFQGAPLFTYRGDLQPGDLNGMRAQRAQLWEPAVVRRYVQPDGISMRVDPEQGPIWVTRDDRPLYTRHRLDDNDFGGRNLVGQFHQSYELGKLIGFSGCNDECLREWQPLRPAQDAVSQGYWEVGVRDDGSRQWLFKGSAVYTYVRDEPGGPVTGTNIYTLDQGEFGPYKVSTIPTIKDPAMFRMGAYYWHVAVPDL